MDKKIYYRRLIVAAIIFCYCIVWGYDLIGTPPTNLIAEQSDLRSVLVSWTAPSPPPSMGYRVTVQPGGITMLDRTPPRLLTGLQVGVYSIEVMSLSRHLPSEKVGPVVVTVRGEMI